MVADDDHWTLDIRAFWNEAIVETDALLGFQMTSPPDSGDLLVLLSRHGKVLARSRGPEELQVVLARHLEAHATPLTESIVRFELRSVRSGRGLVLLGPNVGLDPALPERRLAREQLGLRDAPFVDVDVDGRSVAQTVPHGSDLGRREVDGHADPATDTLDVAGVVWWGGEAGPRAAPSRALVTHALAERARSGSFDTRLRVARKIAERVPIELIDDTNPSTVVAAVRRTIEFQP